MKLLVLVCVCAALAAAEQAQPKVPTPAQLAVGLQHLYRRLLFVAAPKELKIGDALDIQWRDGLMSSKPFFSPVKATYSGAEAPTFNYINSLITPGQKGYYGQWSKQDTSDLITTYHYGGLTKVHMLTDAGIHKEVILGNPLDNDKAKFVVLIPKNTYYFFESLSNDKTTFVTFMDIPAWTAAGQHFYSNKEMETKFPSFAEMFKDLAKPGVHHEYDDEHHDDDEEHDDQDNRRQRLRKFARRRFLQRGY